jgi:outer membrane lipoprotein-sorting protein
LTATRRRFGNVAERIRRWALLSAALTACLCATSIRAADTNAVLNAWFEAQTGLRTWSAGVLQTRSLKALVQPLVSNGRVWVEFPDQFRWELGEPAQTIALRRHDELLVIYPRLRRAERYPLGGSQTGPWRDAAALLEAGFPRSRAELEARFRLLSVAQTNGVCQIALEPRNAMARKLMPELLVTLRVAPFALLATEMRFPDGSRMRNDFTNAVFNPALAASLFDFQPGADFTVVEPLRRPAP